MRAPDRATGRSRNRRRHPVAVLVALLVVAIAMPAATSAHQVAASTRVELPDGAIALGDGVDVTVRTVTSTAPHAGTAPTSTAGVDAGRVMIQLATDGSGAPVPASAVVEWITLNPPGGRPSGGALALPLDLEAWGFRPGTTGGVRALYVSSGGRHAVATHRSAAADLTVVAATAPVARLEVDPGTVLLPGVGTADRLIARAFDATGSALPASVRWTSSDPGTVTVDSDGTLGGQAIGSAQVVAEMDGVVSPPILVVVAEPVAGAILVPDEAIVGEPYEVDPDASGHPGASHGARLAGIVVGVGDIVIGTGDKPLGGRVLRVVSHGDGTVEIVVELVPMPDLFTALDLDEVFDLADAEIIVPADIAAFYDVERSGDTYSFTRRGTAAVLAPATLEPHHATLASTGTDDGAVLPLAAPASPPPPAPLDRCEQEDDGDGGSDLPFTLSAAPELTIEIAPSLSVATDPDGDLEHLLVSAEPKATAKVGVEASVAFEASWTCEVELFAFKIPIGGVFSFFIGGTVPVGLGLGFGGSITAASFEASAQTEVTVDAEVGYVCATAGSCAFHRSLGDPVVTPSMGVDLPSGSDVRIKPVVDVHAFLTLELGSPTWKKLRIEALKATFGAQLQGDLAPVMTQLADDGYESGYELSLVASAGVGADVAKALEKLGVDSLDALALSLEVQLGASPKGTITADRERYQPGDAITVRVDVTEHASLLSFYNVSEIVVVRWSGGVLTELGRQPASTDQTTFTFSLTAVGEIAAEELYAFVDTRLPLDLFDLELGQAVPVTVTVHPSNPTVAPSGTHNFSATVAGIADQAVTWSADCGSITSTGAYTAPSTAGTCTVTATSVAVPGATGTATVSIVADAGIETDAELWACQEVPRYTPLVCERDIVTDQPSWTGTVGVPHSTARQQFAVTVTEGRFGGLSASGHSSSSLNGEDPGLTYGGARLDVRWEWSGPDAPFILNVQLQMDESPETDSDCFIELDGPGDDYRYDCDGDTTHAEIVTGLLTEGSYHLRVWANSRSIIYPPAYSSDSASASYDISMSVGG